MKKSLPQRIFIKSLAFGGSNNVARPDGWSRLGCKNSAALDWVSPVNWIVNWIYTSAIFVYRVLNTSNVCGLRWTHGLLVKCDPDRHQMLLKVLRLRRVKKLIALRNSPTLQIQNATLYLDPT